MCQQSMQSEFVVHEIVLVLSNVKKLVTRITLIILLDDMDLIKGESHKIQVYA